MKPVRLLAANATKRLVLVAVAALVFLAPAWVAQAQVLQQVPSDALVVVKFNKLKPTSDKIAAFSTKLGLAQFQPDFADPLGALQKKMGITQGLDAQGEAAIVLLNGPLSEKQPPALLILPVSDYNAFLKNFPGAKQVDQVSVVKMKGETEDTFVVQRGKYAVMAPKQEYVQAKAEGLTPAGLSAKEVQSKDIVAYVNMKSARTRILPELQKNREKIIAEIEKNMKAAQKQRGGAGRPGGAGAAAGAAGEPGAAAGGAAAAGAANAQNEKFIPLAKAVINRALDVAEQIVTDADAATYGWTFADAGIQATGLVEFAQGSKSAQRVSELKNSDESMLKGLPTGKYWLFGGTSGNNAAVMQKMMDDFLAPVEKEFGALGAEGKALQDYLAALRTYAANMKGQSFGMVAPQGMIGQEAIFQFVSVQRGDAKQLQQAGKQMFDTQQALMGMFGGPMGQQEVKTTYTANAKTIDGVAFDQATTSFNVGGAPGQPATPQQMQAQQMMTWMYGPGGMNMYMGVVDPDTLVTASGSSDALLKQLVASAKADQDTLGAAAPIAATRKQLPQQRLAAWYIQVDQIASSIANYAKAFGMPINFQVPQNLSPLGGAISSEGTAIRMDGYAPTQTLQSVIAAVMQTYMQMQGGMAPGRGGPGGPGGL